MTQLSKMIWFDPSSVRRAMTQNIASPYALEIISSPAYISERGVSFYTVRRALTGCATVLGKGEQRGKETTALGEFHQMGYKWPFIQLNGIAMPMHLNAFHPL